MTKAPPSVNRFVRQPLLGSFFSNQRGLTLVEELVAVAVIGLGLVILVAMITTGTIGVRQIDDHVSAEVLARSQLELIKDAAYQADPITNPYPAASPVAGYSAGTDIRYWNASTSSFSSTLRDDGLQEITVSVSRGASPLLQITGYKVDR